jgi:glycosyltransferase involved in cell wall biosynthesis
MSKRNASTRPLSILAVGDGSHVVTRAQGFARRGHRVFLLTTSPSPSGIEGVTELAAPLDHLTSGGRLRGVLARCPRPLRRALNYGFSAAAFLRAARSCRPDIVHVHSAWNHYGWIAALLGARPLVVTPMGSDVAPFEERSQPETTAEWMTRRLLRQADYITPPSDFLVDIINRLGDLSKRTERIIWGIPLDRFTRRDASDLRRRLSLAPNARVIVSPKILRPLYRIHLLVEAMAIVRRSCPDAVLVMSEYVADAEYQDRIVRRIAELGLGDHTRFSGSVAESEMPAFYSMAEVSIAIPPRDGMPLALFESLACGTPQILSRLPRYEEIVQHEESTYFVDPNPESIAAGIVRLLRDEALRSRIARQGRRIVEEQANLDEQVARVEKRFRELVRSTPPSAVRAPMLLSSALAVAAAYVRFRRPR